MAIQNDNTILNKGDLKAYHERIAPMLGGTFMVSTNNSDYYSTDEKVVGVYDGKPLYQKTWTGLSVSTTASSAVALGISVNNLDKYVDYEASGYHSTAASKRVLTSYIGHLFTENATSATSTFSYYCLYSGVIITDVTLRYTKTTDTAGSATATPGAYDINFPNTWPANKEIFFGNGVYGYRATGTINNTGAASGVDMTIVTIAGFGDFVNYGGSINRGAGKNIHSFPYTNPNGSGNPISFVSWGSGIYANHDSGAVHFMFGTNYTNTDKYDVWFTYTK